MRWIKVKVKIPNNEDGDGILSDVLAKLSGLISEECTIKVSVQTEEDVYRKVLRKIVRRAHVAGVISRHELSKGLDAELSSRAIAECLEIGVIAEYNEWIFKGRKPVI